MATRHAIAETLLKIAREDARIVVVTSDARGSAGIEGFFRELPERTVEVGIAEQAAIGVAAGLALSRKKAYVFGPACFYSARGFEQVKNDVAYTGSNVKVIAVSGGVSYGPLGSTHHSLHDIAALRAIPGIDVILPSDALQATAITQMLVESEKPAYVRVGRNPIPVIYEPQSRFEHGKGVLLREGKEVAIIATGEVVWHALEAAQLLLEVGVNATVVDMPFLKPFDQDLIVEIANRHERIVTVEEHSIYGGLGEVVLHCLAQGPSCSVKIIGIPDEYPITGTQAQVYAHYGLDSRGIQNAVLDFLQRMG